jgi:hypothetical protein
MEIGARTRCMGKEFTAGRTDVFTRVLTSWIKRRVKETIAGQMGECSLVTGRREGNTGRAT